MTDEAPKERRLVIAAGSLSDAEAALVLARAILEWSPARAMGLMIDTEIAGFVMNQGHRIVSTRGTLLRIPSREQARRIARSEARAFEARLAELAAARSEGWTCELSEGEFVSRACAAIEEGDILLLGQRPMLRHRGSVLLVGPGPDVPVPETARSLAEVLARACATVVSALQAGATGEEDDIVARIGRSHAAAVVVDLAAGPLTSEDDLRRLLAAARCPVAVLGGSRVVSRERAMAQQA